MPNLGSSKITHFDSEWKTFLEISSCYDKHRCKYIKGDSILPEVQSKKKHIKAFLKCFQSFSNIYYGKIECLLKSYFIWNLCKIKCLEVVLTRISYVMNSVDFDWGQSGWILYSMP